MKEVCEQTLCRAKHEIIGVLFTKDVMLQTMAEWQNLVNKAILASVPRFLSLNVLISAVANKDQIHSVSQALMNVCAKLLDIVRSSVPHTYQLYPRDPHNNIRQEVHQLNIGYTSVRHSLIQTH